MTSRETIHETTADAWGERAALRAALERSELEAFAAAAAAAPVGPLPEAARKAALGVAVALGRCRLSGVDPGDDGGILSAEVATAATTALVEVLERGAARAGGLGERFDAAIDPIEPEHDALDLLRLRMDAWAAFLAIDEASQAALEDEDGEGPGAAFEAGLAALLDALDAYDAELRAQLDVLSIVADTGLLDHWRTGLAPEFAATPPWWLDGSLEREAQRLDRQALELAPDAWLPRPAIERIAALEGDSPASEPRPDELRWHSPDGTLIAKLELPPRTESRLGEDQVLEVLFVSPRGDVARIDALIGAQTATLAGVERAIGRDTDGKVLVRFRLGDLRRAGLEPSLTIGDDVWRRTPG